MKSKFIYIAIILVFYLLLPMLILVGILDFSHKFMYLTFGAAAIYAILKSLNVSDSEMGITTKSSLKSVKDVSKFTFALFVVGAGLYFLGFGERFNPTETIDFYLFYIFISSPIQEFLYRGALLKMFAELKINPKRQVIFSSLLYSFTHIIYKDLLTLVITFVLGIIWCHYYQKTKNLLGVSASHAVLGALTILTGIID